MKKILPILLLCLIVRTGLGQAVPDLIRTIATPATGSNANNRASVDANLYASKNLRIPRGASFSLNGAKDSIGYVMFNTTLNRFGVYVGSGTWQTYLVASDIPTTLAWTNITDKPTTLSGYGITDGISLTYFNGNIGTSTAASIATKEPLITTGTTLQYWRGDKTFQTLNTAAVPELTNLYYTNARGIGSTLTGYTSGAGTVSASDNILQAIQKLNGNISGLVTGVSSFNSRTGAVTLNSGDVTTALGFTPENVANKATSLSTLNNTLYPTTQAVANYVTGLALTPGNNTTIAGGIVSNQVGTTQYSKSYWTSLTGLSTSGTISVVANSIRMNSVNAYVRVSAPVTADANFEYETIYKVGTLGAVTLGRVSTQTLFFNSGFFTLDETANTVLLTNGYGTGLKTTILPFTIAINDVIRLKFSCAEQVTTVSIENITQNKLSYFNYNNSLFNSNNFAISNIGVAQIQNLSGVRDIQVIKITSQSNINPNVMVLGNSKVEGTSATGVPLRFGALLQSLGTINIQGANGAATADFLTLIPHILSVKPKYIVLVDLMRNDLASAIPLATSKANYASIVSQLQAGGINVIHLIGLGEPGLDQSVNNNYIIATYPSGSIISLISTWDNTTMVDPIGGVHQNDYGNRFIASNIIGSGLIPLSNNYTLNLRDYIGVFPDISDRYLAYNKGATTVDGISVEKQDVGLSFRNSLFLSPNATAGTLGTPSGTTRIFGVTDYPLNTMEDRYNYYGSTSGNNYYSMGINGYAHMFNMNYNSVSIGSATFNSNIFNVGSSGQFGITSGGNVNTTGTVTAPTLIGALTGNSTSATALQTARTIGTITGDATSAGSSFDGSANNTNSITVTKLNGVSLAGLSTGILKNTTSTGVPSIAIAGTDYVVPSGNIATATTLSNSRTIWGQNFNGSANVTGNMSGVGQITSTQGNNTLLYQSTSATTGYQYIQISNSGGNLRFGIENSTGGGLGIGTDANAAIFGNATSSYVNFVAAGTKVGGFNGGNFSINNLTASQLVATDASKNLVSVTALPSGTTAQTILPTSNNVYSLGSPSFKWANIYASSAYFTAATITSVATSAGGYNILTQNSTTGQVESIPSTAYSTGTTTVDATSTSYSMVAGTRYVSDSGSLITFTLPATATVGQIFIITGGVSGTGLWKIAQNSGQSIHGATNTTTGTGGSVTATGQYNSIQIVCTKANTDFTVQSSQGALTIL